MFKKPNCPVIAIEEHYWDPELAKHFTGPEAGRGNETDERLYDLGALRIKEMDEAGIDIQLLSHGAPSAQKMCIRDSSSVIPGRAVGANPESIVPVLSVLDAPRFMDSGPGPPISGLPEIGILNCTCRL